MKGLRVELQWALALLPLMRFVVAVEVITRTKMVDQTTILGKVAAAPPYKNLGQGPWELGDSKRPRNELRTGTRNYQNSTRRGVHGVCNYCGGSEHVAEMCS